MPRVRLWARMDSFPFAACADRPLYAIARDPTGVECACRIESDVIAVELAIGDLNGITAAVERARNRLIGLFQGERPVAKLPSPF